MLRIARVMLTALFLVGVASAGEEPTAPAPASVTPEEVAAKVLQAIASDDTAALGDLAASLEPGPWLVADELCRRGEHAAATALAAARDHPDLSALPAYVASRRDADEQTDARTALAKSNEPTTSDPAAALEPLSKLDPGGDDVVSILVVARIAALEVQLGRHEEALKGYRDAATRAERIGWLSAASDHLVSAVTTADARRDFATAVKLGERLITLEQKRESAADEAVAYVNLAWHLRSVGALKKAAAAADRAWQLLESVDEPERTRAGMTQEAFEGIRTVCTLHRAYACWDRGDESKGARLCSDAAAEFERLELAGRAAQTRGTLGDHLVQVGRSADAIIALTPALEAFEQAENAQGVAWVCGTLGLAYSNLSRFEEALTAYTRVHEIATKMGATHYIAHSLRNLGAVHWRLAHWDDAIRQLQEAKRLFEELKNPQGVAATLTNLGLVHHSLSEFAEAVSLQQQALAIEEAAGDHAGIARALNNLSGPYVSEGRYAEAMRTIERALEQARKSGDRSLIATTLGNLAAICTNIDANQRALALLEEALDLKTALEDRVGMAATRMHIGRTLQELGRYEAAHAALSKARAEYRDLDDKHGEANVLIRLGGFEENAERFAEAHALYVEARDMFEALGSTEGMGWADYNLGDAFAAAGQSEPAIAALKRSLATAEHLGDLTLEALSLSRIAEMHIALGAHGDALITARTALGHLPQLVGGLVDDEGAAARSRFGDVYVAGVTAATHLGDAEAYVEFVEAGRAGALLEGLKGSASLRDWVVPEKLRALEQEARREEAATRVRLRRAVDDGSLKAIRSSRAEQAAARHRVAEVVRMIRSRARAAADVVYPEADSLQTIRSRVRDGEALLLYALLPEEVVALVVTGEETRIARLGEMDSIEAAARACAELGPDSDPLDLANRLRELLLDPLKLEDGIERLLISPDGVLSYVPFAMLDRTREIAYLPSGTTYGVLVQERGKRGGAVLAVGDPSYGGQQARGAGSGTRTGATLTPLPFSRDEVLAVGDETLLGNEASESRFRDTVQAGTRWRAVHLACHGLVDGERPMLSSLALTADEANDGLLTVLDVFRMKIPSDLVVLSACQTAEGQVHRVAGVMGFARAFMFAGSPRVIVSLWRVDDAATQALMAKFYELWNPEDAKAAISPAAALKQAQDHIAAQPKWKHPHFWAAWQLWGLPD